MIPYGNVVCENSDVTAHALHWRKSYTSFRFHAQNVKVKPLRFFRLESVRAKLHLMRLFQPERSGCNLIRVLCNGKNAVFHFEVIGKTSPTIVWNFSKLPDCLCECLVYIFLFF
jgi:hypothetical protein